MKAFLVLCEEKKIGGVYFRYVRSIVPEKVVFLKVER
jgi:hypothetical protein